MTLYSKQPKRRFVIQWWFVNVVWALSMALFVGGDISVGWAAVWVSAASWLSRGPLLELTWW